jgi:hypothetical protein
VSVSQVLSSLGVPESAASNGTSIGLHNVAQLRDLFDIGLPPEQRVQHADALLGGVTAPDGQPGVSLTQRLIRNVVGNDELSAEDQAQLAPAFPVTAHVTAQPPAAAPMQVNYVWDVSMPDGSMRLIDLPNGIELQDGGCIVARATPLHFSCSSFTRTGGPPAGYSGDFNILGRTGAPVPIPLVPTTPGQAPAGAPGQCTSTGIAGDGGGNGTPGQQGTAGTPGVRGNDGIASAIATIAITGSVNVAGATSKLLVVAAQSGPGGPGGNGGQGAAGQQGGNGGNGAYCECTGNGGGSAGAGGRGGTGGRAGDGGNGVDAAGDIALWLPNGVSTKLLQFVPTPAPPGSAGSPGLGGNGGAPGTAGTAGKHNSAGSGASPGPTGDPGANGNSGTHTGVPAKLNPGNLPGAAGQA